MAIIYEWMMIFVRAGGLMVLLPVFSSASVPVPLRIAIAGALAYIVSGFLPLPASVPPDVASLVLVVVHELLIGLLMGFGARLIFYAVEFAGQVMSTEIGL